MDTVVASLDSPLSARKLENKREPHHSSRNSAQNQIEAQNIRAHAGLPALHDDRGDHAAIFGQETGTGGASSSLNADAIVAKHKKA